MPRNPIHISNHETVCIKRGMMCTGAHIHDPILAVAAMVASGTIGEALRQYNKIRSHHETFHFPPPILADWPGLYSPTCTLRGAVVLTTSPVSMSTKSMGVAGSGK